MDTVTAIREWAAFLARVRRFFDERGFVEVTTKHLVPAGAFEGVIDTLQVPGRGELHTSPEMEMKALLSKSGLSCYQICRCFRDDPLETGIHGKEFTMLEFYSMGSDYGSIRRLMIELLSAVGYGGKVTEKTVTELMGGTLPPAKTGERWEDTFFRRFLEEVEPKLPADPPTLVKDYPAQIAALAALNSDGKTAQRFEIYWKGMEICNGCVELGDAKELAERIEQEQAVRKAAGKAPHPRPKGLEEALERGLPDCAGVAVGLDRLFKCLTGRFSPSFP